MLPRIASVLTILLSPILIISEDGLAYLFGGNESTISRISLEISQKYPSFRNSVCFLFGVLVAHLFAPRPGTGPANFPWLPVVAVVGIPLVVVFTNLVVYMWPETGSKAVGSYPQWDLLPVMFWLIVGALSGFFAVAQHRGAP